VHDFSKRRGRFRRVKGPELDDQTVGGIEASDPEVDRSFEIEDDAGGAGSGFRHANAADQGVRDLASGEAAARNPGPGVRDIEEEALGVVGAIRLIFKRSAGFNDHAGGIGVGPGAETCYLNYAGLRGGERGQDSKKRRCRRQSPQHSFTRRLTGFKESDSKFGRLSLRTLQSGRVFRDLQR